MQGLEFDEAAWLGRGRYVLENDERVDVLVARTVPTVDGVRVALRLLEALRKEEA